MESGNGSIGRSIWIVATLVMMVLITTPWFGLMESRAEPGPRDETILNEGSALTRTSDLESIQYTTEWKLGYGTNIGADKTGLIANLDGTGVNELVLGNAEGFIQVFHWETSTLQELWSSPKLGEGISGCAFGDLDQDGGKELIACSPDGTFKAYTYSASGFTSAWEGEASGWNIGPIELIHLPGNTYPQILMKRSANEVALLGWNQSTLALEQLWSSGALADGIASFTVANIDGVVGDELVVVNGAGVLTVYHWQVGAVTPETPVTSTSIGIPTGGAYAFDVHDDAIEEVVVGLEDGTVAVIRFAGTTPGSPVISPGLGSDPQDAQVLGIGDMCGDALPEVLCVDGANNLYVLRVTPGSGGATFEFNVTDTGLTASAAQIGNLDDTAVSEVVLSGEGAGFAIYAWDSVTDFQQVWSGDVSGTAFYGLATGDVSGDSRPEIVMGDNTGVLRLISYDSLTSTYKTDWTSQDLGSAAYGVAIGDVDLDSHPDIVTVGYEGVITVFNGDGSGSFEKLWQSGAYDLGQQVYALALADVDNDTVTEIITGGANGKFTVFGFDGATFLLEYESNPTGSDLYALTTADLDNDGLIEVAAGNAEGVLFIHAYNTSTEEYQLRWISGLLGAELLGCAAGDLDGDGVDEIMVGDGSGGVYVVEYSSGTFKKSKVTELFTSAVVGIAIADIDGTGHQEAIVSGAGGQIGIVNYTTATGEYHLTSTSSPIGANVGYHNALSIGDVDGDTQHEIVLGGTGMVQIGRLGEAVEPPSGTIALVSTAACINTTAVLLAVHASGTATHIRFRVDAGDWGAWLAVGQTMVVDIDTGGVHSIHAQFAASASGTNPSSTVSTPVELDLSIPTITLTSPSTTTMTTTNTTVTISGTTESDAELTMNDTPVSLMDGVFNLTVNLSVGTTSFTLKAMDCGWNIDTVTITVTRTVEPEDITPPALNATKITELNTDLPTDGMIQVVFTEPMDPASIVITVKDQDGKAVEGQVNYIASTHIATFTPKKLLTSATTYQVTASGSDLAGNTVSDQTFSFTTKTVTTQEAEKEEKAAAFPLWAIILLVVVIVVAVIVVVFFLLKRR